MTIGESIGHANVILAFRLWGGHKSELTATGQMELERAAAYAAENPNDSIIHSALEYADKMTYLRSAKQEDWEMHMRPERTRYEYKRTTRALAQYLESQGVRIPK